MAWDKGFNFRETSAWVSPTSETVDCTYVLGTESTPTTRNSVTFQWNADVSGNARNRSQDANYVEYLAGMIFCNSGTQTFTVTLPEAGTYKVRLAVGDATSGWTTSTVTIKDNGTTRLTINSQTLSAAEFIDATNTKRTTAADWNANNAFSSNLTFDTTTFQMVIDGASLTPVAHLYISQVETGVGTGGPFPARYFAEEYWARRYFPGSYNDGAATPSEVWIPKIWIM